ncbi:MAG TPA: NAD(P)-binding domain-containing protein, partial [Anaerolineales bacterium]|nr:NAD(P)-binding domain-containing protein [Anaerolineales bacterium]
MNVTIIGPGNMGRAIGTRAAAGGHSVTFVGDKLETAEQAAKDVKASTKNSAQVSTANLENIDLGDIVVLALWYGVNKQVAGQLADKLNGKIVVDIANPLTSTFDNLATPPNSSSAEEVAQAAPGAKVVKAFN